MMEEKEIVLDVLSMLGHGPEAIRGWDFYHKARPLTGEYLSYRKIADVAIKYKLFEPEEKQNGN